VTPVPTRCLGSELLLPSLVLACTTVSLAPGSIGGSAAVDDTGDEAVTSPRPTRAEVLAACELGPDDTIISTWSWWDDYTPWSSADSWAGKAVMDRPISEPCAESLGAALGMDWSSFGEGPVAFDTPTTIGQLVVSGILQLTAGDYGSVGELQASLTPTELLTTDVAETLEPNQPAAQLFFDYVQGHVEQMSWHPEDELSCFFAYEDGDVHVCLGGLAFSTADQWNVGGFPPFVASALVHEAGHDDGPAHVDQDDADCNGTYGAGARVLEAWLAESGPQARPLDIDTVEYGLSIACAHIVDAGSSCPCD